MSWHLTVGGVNIWSSDHSHWFQPSCEQISTSTSWRLLLISCQLINAGVCVCVRAEGGLMKEDSSWVSLVGVRVNSNRQGGVGCEDGLRYSGAARQASEQVWCRNLRLLLRAAVTWTIFTDYFILDILMKEKKRVDLIWVVFNLKWNFFT